MRHKAVVIIAIALCIITVSRIIIAIPRFKIEAANAIYGKEKCTCDEEVNIGLPSAEIKICPICWKIHKNNYMDESALCDSCLEITNRCGKCSGIK